MRVIPYGGTFKLTMDVERVEPGRTVKWVAWFGNLVSKGYTETDDAKAYRSKAGPPTQPIASIVGFEDRFRGRPVQAIPKPGMHVRPSGGKAGAAYSFHVTAKGHNSALYPLWLRPVKEGENVLYATVHQRFVYHLMFRLTESHFARYELAAHAHKVARMMLPYTVLLVEDRGGRKRLLCVYQGEVALNAFPVEQLRRGAGVTVESVEAVPKRVWPAAAAGGKATPRSPSPVQTTGKGK